jgi:dTDP-glucose 4,6-dehydratase
MTVKKILITGGAGFIGSHVVRRFVNNYPNYEIVNLDALTYAGNLANLTDIENKPNYKFVKEDITDAGAIMELFKSENFDAVIHLAAESHVDRSIADPTAFVMTNVIGTVNLLNAAREYWKGSYDQKRFYHVSTDEVYGALGEEGMFTETTSYDPHSPYSASKASSDHFVRAYHDTYGMDCVISNCSNNYGSHHFPEKLIPLAINNIKNNKPVPVYGESATENRPPRALCINAARVKRCGKSAPRFRRRKRHGKPHREQDRIGTAREKSRISPDLPFG